MSQSSSNKHQSTGHYISTYESPQNTHQYTGQKCILKKRIL